MAVCAIGCNLYFILLHHQTVHDSLGHEYNVNKVHETEVHGNLGNKYSIYMQIR